MMKHLAVIDTNVLVAAHLSSLDDSAVVQVFHKIINGAVVPLYSKEIIREYKEVLSRKKFSLDPNLIDYTIALILNRGIQVEPKPSGLTIVDMKDLVFYEVVLEKKDEGSHLVTGNKKHFPNDPIVVTAAEFLQIIDKG